MSRKPRKPPKLELVPNQPADDPLDLDPNRRPVTGRPRAIFDALVHGCVLLARGPISAEILNTILQDVGFAEPGGPPPFITLDAPPPELDDAEALEAEERALDEEISNIATLFAEYEAGTQVLARTLLAELVGRPVDRNQLTAGGRRVDIGGQSVDDLIRRFDPTSFPPAFRPLPSETEAAFFAAEDRVREIGLEEFDIYCSFGYSAHDALEVYIEPISLEAASIMLMDFVFERCVETLTLDGGEAARLLEEAATTWEFDRWSAPLALASTAEASRELRAEEYYMIDRPSIALGETPVGRLTGPDRVADMPPRQAHVARCLTESFVDVFEVMAIDGERTTFRSILHDVTYDVYLDVAHAMAPDLRPGWIVAGRLVPFAGGLHLPSPGVFFAAPEAGLADRIVATFSRLSESIHSALALEGALSSEVYGKALPLEPKPVTSRSHARIVLEEMEEMIAAGFEPDETFSSYRKALKRQAETRASAPRSKGKSARSKRKRR